MTCCQVRPLSRIIVHFLEEEMFYWSRCSSICDKSSVVPKNVRSKNAWELPVKEFSYSKVASLYQFSPKEWRGSQVF